MMPKEAYSDYRPLLGNRYESVPLGAPVIVPQALRRRPVPMHGILFALLVVVVTLHVISPSIRHIVTSPVTSPTHATGTPLSGPLELPGQQCRAWGDAVDAQSSYGLSFGAGHNLTVHQSRTHHHNGPHERRQHVRVSGAVVVRRADAAHAAGAVDIETMTNDERIGKLIALGVEPGQDQLLRVQIDDDIRLDDRDNDRTHGSTPCLVARITVWVPANQETVALGFLGISATNLDILLAEGLDLSVRVATQLNTVSGDIVAAAALPGADSPFWLDAAGVYVHSVSGGIRGSWGLRQQLHFSTVSGDVHVSVEERGSATAELVDLAAFDQPLEPAQPLDVGLPNLRIGTISGDITLTEMPSVAAAPGHSLALSSKSGLIKASAAFAGFARVNSISGGQHLALHLLELTTPALLETSAVSGTIKLGLSYADDATLDFLQSHHCTVSGGIQLHYPSSWAGRIQLTAVASGHVALLGKDVHVLPDDRPHWPPHRGNHIAGTKGVAPGEDASNVTAQTKSGSILLAFPE
ncbi:hypothetical protein CMQ_763 [Grosmannia clavigera kw1407]|uniref:Adhesin domain-containing protein n=1 Tax=Grosmannia clavigera (strain kw1407 / UAMH 11150) TaxID=655863 RepID=F0XDK7_GROCL|nr:uncharacterized protein CMQ_763 [Grosmannia clavigera kw1407]EFX03835.1 hypothetical protein CMQ_763 [Grosmannia clavigera kw1407]